MIGNNAIKDFIIRNIRSRPSDVVRFAANYFGISVQAINKHVKDLIAKDILIAIGNTKSRKYELVTKTSEYFYDITGLLGEDAVLRNDIHKYFENLPDNVKKIWNYSFTEMFNNAIDHSDGKKINVIIKQDILDTVIIIQDDGVGIFKKIGDFLKISDAREVVAELAKGKFTTDPERHSGEGIFFTSRMVDAFFIHSYNVSWGHRRDKADWIFDENEKDELKGTSVFLRVSNNSDVIVKDVFDKYGNPDFNSTVIPVILMDSTGEGLVSRSQAKRLLNRLEKFNIVYMDFSGIKSVGQAFADEIFRVYKLSNPGVQIIEKNAEEEVQNMIKRARNNTLAIVTEE